MRYLLLPLLLIYLPVAHAADTDFFNNDDQQILDGSAWKMYGNLFSNDATLYSPLGYSIDKHLGVATLEPWREVRAGGGRSPLWQDPERGLVSAIASYLEYDSEQLYRFGAEGEWYYGTLTASGRAGYLDGTLESVPFAGLDLRWYATDNLSFQVGGEHFNDDMLGRVRMEYQPGFETLQGLSFFARAAAGSNQDNQYVLGGFRYSFGESGSLLLRDRHNPSAAAADRLSPRFESLYYRQ